MLRIFMKLFDSLERILISHPEYVLFSENNYNLSIHFNRENNSNYLFQSICIVFCETVNSISFSNELWIKCTHGLTNRCFTRKYQHTLDIDGINAHHRTQPKQNTHERICHKFHTHYFQPNPATKPNFGPTSSKVTIFLVNSKTLKFVYILVSIDRWTRLLHNSA